MNFVRYMELLPWTERLGTALLRDLYIQFVGFVLAELDMASELAITHYGRFIAAQDPRRLCLRAVREFALLGRVSDSELRHAVASIAQHMKHADDVHAIAVWGSADAWVEIEPCVARLREGLERYGVPSTRLRTQLLDGANHGIGRQRDRDFVELAALLWEVCEHAQGAAHASARRPQEQATETMA